jgi:GH24 family phage-related lysozyme (muramidase)
MNKPAPRTLKVGKGPAAGFVVLASGALLTFLALFESSGNTVLKVYADELANGLPTVCDGITRHVTATPIIVGEVWTVEKCEAETIAAVTKVQRQVGACFTRVPPQSVFDAATSHAWNLGAGKTCGSAAMAAWNRGEWALGCRRLTFADDGRPVWAYAGGKFVRGLHRRRGEETKFCVQFEAYKP